MINQDKKENTKENSVGAWWAPAVEILVRVSSYIVVPIIIALILGKNLDKYFDTRPYIFISLISFSFLFSCYGIYKVMKDYSEKLKKIKEDNID